MSAQEVIKKVEELQELRRMQEELNAEIESLQDEIKAHMVERETDQLTAGAWKVSYKAVTSSRFDSARFKKEHADLAAAYTKTTTSRRFCVN